MILCHELFSKLAGLRTLFYRLDKGSKNPIRYIEVRTGQRTRSRILAPQHQPTAPSASPASTIGQAKEGGKMQWRGLGP